MIVVLAMIAGLTGGPVAARAPVTAARIPEPAVRSVSAPRGDAVKSFVMPQHFAPEFRALALPNTNQLPPPCPPSYQLPLYGLMTLPVQQMGICNAHDWRPQWYNLTGP